MLGRSVNLMAAGASPARLVSTWGGYSLKPRDIGARRGDLLVCTVGGLISPNSPPWQGEPGLMLWRSLSSSELDQTFVHYYGGPDGSYFEALLLRDAVSLVRRIGLFQKAPNHAGLIMATFIDPLSLISAPRVQVAGITVPTRAHFYWAPPNGKSNNLHPYLYPDFPTMPDNASITVQTTNPSYPPNMSNYEILGA